MARSLNKKEADELLGIAAAAGHLVFRAYSDGNPPPYMQSLQERRLIWIRRERIWRWCDGQWTETEYQGADEYYYRAGLTVHGIDQVALEKQRREAA